MPERFLLQILRNLVTRGILRSTRGVDGGYVLCQSLEETSLLDLMEAIDGPFSPRIPAHAGLSSEARVKLECALSGVTKKLREELGKIKLAHLSNGHARKRD